MAGRRLRESIKNSISEDQDSSVSDVTVIIAGLSNIYSDYVATPEEYQVIFLKNN